jgi:hypothetical protein
VWEVYVCIRRNSSDRDRELLRQVEQGARFVGQLYRGTRRKPAESRLKKGDTDVTPSFRLVESVKGGDIRGAACADSISHEIP